jgi:ferredoxin-type protein NapF
MNVVDLERRGFLRGKKVALARPFRLPWSISELIFTTYCNQCGDCSPVCEPGVIVTGEDGYPFVDSSKGECTFCGACVTACSQPLFIDDKSQEAWPAELTINDRCLAKNQIYCDSCRDSCDQNAIQFRYMGSAIPVPVVDNSLCNGCGACVSICPQKSTQLSLRREPAFE